MQAISNLLPVNFHGDRVFLVAGPNEEPYVVLGTVVKSMGLDWSSQHTKIKNNPRLGMAMFPIPTKTGPQPMVCIPLRKFPYWLSSINPTKIKEPVLREKIIQYQDECDDVLWESWQIKVGAKPAPMAFPQTFPEALRALADESEARAKAEQEKLLERQAKIKALQEKSELEEELGNTKATLELERTFSDKNGVYTVKEVSDILHKLGCPLGQNSVFRWMRENSWVCSSGSKKNMPFKTILDKGLLETHPIRGGTQTYVTLTGLAKMKKLMQGQNLLD
jgi:phage antirepressor YoqD-like protein